MASLINLLWDLKHDTYQSRSLLIPYYVLEKACNPSYGNHWKKKRRKIGLTKGISYIIISNSFWSKPFAAVLSCSFVICNVNFVVHVFFFFSSCLYFCLSFFFSLSLIYSLFLSSLLWVMLLMLDVLEIWPLWR